MRIGFLFRRLLPAAGAAVTLALTAILPASAHEVRPVGGYTFTVGWLHEPAYVDEQNAVQFLLKDAKGNPVTDIGDTLKVEIIFENQKMPAQSLTPTYDPDTGLGRQGEFLASVIPTRPGTYTFHFAGTLNGQTIDQSFTSGPNTFDEVKDPAGVEFPAQDPTRAQLSQRVIALDPRLASVQTAATRDSELARNLAIIALVLGALGVLGGGVALTRGRRGPGL